MQDKTIMDKQELMEEFDIARMAYPGKKRGLDVEFENFRKKHKKWHLLIPLLLPAIEYHKAWRVKAAGWNSNVIYNSKDRLHIAFWKNFSTWINQSCWTDEYPEPWGIKPKAKPVPQPEPVVPLTVEERIRIRKQFQAKLALSKAKRKESR